MKGIEGKGRGLTPWARAVLAALLLACAPCGKVLAQGGAGTPGSAVPKATTGKTVAAAKAPLVKVAGNYGQWALVCEEINDASRKEPCSLMQALVEHDSQKIVFRLTVAYGPKGNLVFRIDSPNGVALQKGVEFSPDAVKTYRIPFETCLPQGCSALLLMGDDLRHDIEKSQKGTITVYALNGKAVQAVTPLNGFGDGLAALDKRRGTSP
jgi:invasion protein IalB